MPTKHLLIKGRVQGVFYRATAREEAEKRGLTGWVKNTGEGHVEMMVSGEEQPLTRFIEWCWQGPLRAEVKAVEVEEVAEAIFPHFTVLRG